MAGAFDSSFDSSFDIGEDDGPRPTLLGTGDDEPLDSRRGSQLEPLLNVLDSTSRRSTLLIAAAVSILRGRRGATT